VPPVVTKESFDGPLSTEVPLRVCTTVDLILDVNGYFE
jgi:hypothetical protein